MREDTDMDCSWENGLREPARRTRIPRSAPAILAGACVVGGLLLAVADGSLSGRAPVQPVATAPRNAPGGAVPERAAAHRKQVFDERRARFDAAHRFPPTDVAAGR